jgi:hypothetical protein
VTDDIARYGLGALPDAPDERDYPLSALYASHESLARAPDLRPGRLGRLDGLRGVSPRMPGARPTPVSYESPWNRPR